MNTEPNEKNIVPDNAFVIVNPLYARVKTIAKMFDISPNTVYRMLERAEGNPDYKDLSSLISHGMRLVSIPTFTRLIVDSNNKCLTDHSQAQKKDAVG